LIVREVKGIPWTVHLELVEHAGRLNVNDTSDPLPCLNKVPESERLAALSVTDGLQFRRAKHERVGGEPAQVQMVLTACPLHYYQRYDGVAICTFCRRSCAVHARLNRALERLERPMTKERVRPKIAKRVGGKPPESGIV